MNGFFFAVAAAVTWGVVYTIDQKNLMDISPLSLLLVNAVLSVCIMLPLVLYFEDGAFIRKVVLVAEKDFWFLLLSLVLALGADFFIFSAIKALGAPTASVIEISYPFFVTLFGILFLRAAPGLAFYLGSLLVFAGSAVIVYFQ